MAPKGKGNGKGAWKGAPPPWMQKGPKELALKGRTLISDVRFVGCINEWHGSWGWIEPLDVVNHPQIKKNKGRIYVHRADARGYIKMEAGTQVEFQIYCDARGLGSVDVTEVQAGAVEAAAAVAAASDEVVLPEGWEKHWSAEHSEHFYWNSLSKERSWLPPQAVDEEEEQEEDESLPAGWTKHYDAEQKQWYYWDKVKKKASWDKPDVQAKREAPKGRPATEPPSKKAKLSEPAAEAPVLGQMRLRGRVVEWHQFFGWITPLQELSADLQPLLEKGDDKIYLNWRDVQPGVVIEAEQEVEFMLYEDDNGLAASDVSLPGAKTLAGKQPAVATKLARQWAAEDEEEEAGEAAEAAAAAEEGDDEENDGPLLPGWDQVWSDEHACFYYWHKATKVAAWERPSMPAGLDGDEEENEEEAGVVDAKFWDGEGVEAGAVHMATPMTPLVSQAGRAMTPVTPGAGRAAGAVQRGGSAPTPSRNAQHGKGASRMVGGSGLGARFVPAIRSQRAYAQQPRRYLQAWER